jgi:hypothetical protein
VPKRVAIGYVREAKDFLHAAVAVRGNDQDRSGKFSRRATNPQHRVVVKLALLPMIDELIPVPAKTHVIEERAKHERIRQICDDRVVSRLHNEMVARRRVTLKPGRVARLAGAVIEAVSEVETRR